MAAGGKVEPAMTALSQAVLKQLKFIHVPCKHSLLEWKTQVIDPVGWSFLAKPVTIRRPLIKFRKKIANGQKKFFANVDEVFAKL